MEKVLVFWNNKHKCFIRGTKPFKIDGIKTQKNELEVGNPSLKWVNSHAMNEEFSGLPNSGSFLASKASQFVVMSDS